MDELEEIQAGQRKGFEAMHTSHWQFYFVLFCLLDFVCLFLFCLFFVVVGLSRDYGCIAFQTVVIVQIRVNTGRENKKE